MLEFDDIQHLLLTRAPALTARYEFLSFHDGAAGRAWASAIKETIHSAASMRAGVDQDKRWVTAAFTWNGLRALGLDEASLASFPEEFKQGMAARAEILGDTGLNAPEHWVGGLASLDLHAIVILFARDPAEHDRCVSEHGKLMAGCPGVEVLSVLDLQAIPPFGYAHEHFGYRDRLSEPAIEGNGVEPTPGTGEPLKPGEFILGYPDEYGFIADSPRPEILARNGSYMAYRRLEEHVGKFREFLRQHGDTAEEQELIAAKLMGRWRSGAPLVLAPEKDDPALGADMQRNNDFTYKEMDPHGYAVPLGSHIRRMKSSRHGAQHEPAPDDPPRGAVWASSARRRSRRRGRARDRRLRHLREPHPPVRVRPERLDKRPELQRAGQRTRPDHRRPRRHARVQDSQATHSQENRRFAGLHHSQRRCVLLSPGPQGAWLSRLTERTAGLSRQHDKREDPMSAQASARTYNQDHIPRKYTPGKRRVSIYWTWSYPWESQRDLAEMDNRFSTMTEVRRVAWPAYETQEWSAAQFLQGIAGTLELFHRSTLSFQKIAGETTGHPVAVFQRIDQAGYKLPIDERILADADTLMVFGLDHILSEQEAAPEEIAAIREWLKRDGACLLLAPHHDVGFTGDMKQRQVEYLHHGDPLVPRQQRFGQYTRSLMKGLGIPVHNTYGLRPALVKGTNEIAPLTPFHDLDSLSLLRNVPTLNFHPHLPHYELTGGAGSIQVLARQPIDLERPHPFTEAGNREFNCLLWMPPNEQRAGDIVLVDSTNFTTLFGGTNSLETFWRNLAAMR